MESRKAIRKRLVKQKRSLFIQKSIGVTTVLASTSGVFTTLVNAPEANATGVNETEVAKSTKSTATTTLARSSETTINRQFKTTASLNVRSDASTSARIINGVGNNTTIKAVAQKSGTSVNGNTTWYKLSSGGWISGAYVTTASNSNSSNNSTSGETAVNKTVKTTAALNVRSSASTSASVVRGLSSNATVIVVAQKSGTSVNGTTTWYKLSNGGWITAAYVQAVSSGSTTSNPGNTSTTEQAISKNVKTTASLNVRSSASTSGSVVGSLSNSTTVKVVAQKSGSSVNGNKTWYKLSTGGWITAAYVKEVSGNTTTNPGNSGNNTIGTNINGAAIVAEARKYIGTPYQWGGKGPDVFDCSGFTRYVFLQVTGKNIGDWTVPQESAGTIIPVSQAQAGDLLFWGEKGNTYHVAIATGNGSFIHAPSTGYTVTEASSGFSTASFALRVK